MDAVLLLVLSRLCNFICLLSILLITFSTYNYLLKHLLSFSIFTVSPKNDRKNYILAVLFTIIINIYFLGQISYSVTWQILMFTYVFDLSLFSRYGL
jgi:hypothetical protein